MKKSRHRNYQINRNIQYFVDFSLEENTDHNFFQFQIEEGRLKRCLIEKITKLLQKPKGTYLGIFPLHMPLVLFKLEKVFLRYDKNVQCTRQRLFHPSLRICAHTLSFGLRSPVPFSCNVSIL